MTDPTPSLAEALIWALANIDWRQILLNNLESNAGACFALDGKHICGRAHKWAGHDSHHIYTPLHVAVTALLAEARKDQPAADALTPWEKAKANEILTAAPSPEPAPLCEEAREWRLVTECAALKLAGAHYHDALHPSAGTQLARGESFRVLCQRLDEAAAAWSAEKRNHIESWKARVSLSARLSEERDAAVRERDEARETLALLTADAQACEREIADLRARLAAAEREKHAWAAKKAKATHERMTQDWLASKKRGGSWQDGLGRAVIITSEEMHKAEAACEEAAAKANGEVGNG